MTRVHPMVDTTILVDGFGKSALDLQENVKKIHAIFTPFNCTYDIISLDPGFPEESFDAAPDGPRKISRVSTKNKKYGDALREAFGLAQGDYILMIDENLLFSPEHVKKIWNERMNVETIIASRYFPGSFVYMPRLHFFFSRLLNRIFHRVLSLPVFDLSCGLRMFNSSIMEEIRLESHDYDILLEILVKTYIHGYAIKEIPIAYRKQIASRSFTQNVRLFFIFLATAYKMWKLRNTIEACDYDERAFSSPIFFQRYWQKKRHSIILNAASNIPSVLDIGCGSSRILSSLPRAVGMDIDIKKVRYMRKYDNPVLCGSTFQLPFKNESFDGVISSEIIEHVKKDEALWKEMRRVLKPGGTLVLGTPDYGSKLWIIIEALYKKLAPGGYGDEHISHYSRDELIQTAKRHGFAFQTMECVFASEMIGTFTKI